MARRRRVLTRGIGGGSVIPGDVADDYFAAQGGTQPWYAGSTQYNALTTGNKTYVAWETYDRVADKRFCQIRAFTHATSTWGRIYTVGKMGNIEDDDHGVPAMAVNADGRISIAYGNHDGNLHFSTMTNANDETHWTTLTDGLVGRYTYPHLILISTTVYVLLRLDVQPGAEFAAGAKVLVYRPVTYAGAVATIGAEVRIGDMGNNSRWYQGNMLDVSSRAAQVCCRADYGDTFRRDVYYYEVDFTNARLQSFSGATSAFPVARATMDSTFRIRTTTAPAVLGIPAFQIDDISRTHIIFGEGETNPIIYHIIGSSGVFDSPVSIFTNTGASPLADGPRLIDEANGKLGMYYPVDTGALYTRGGKIRRRLLINGGDTADWATEEVVMNEDASRWPLGQIGLVFSGHQNARVIFTEISETDADSAATPWKRTFVLGDSGFLPHTRTAASAPATFAAEGAFYDPSDGSTLWSDTARTTAATLNGVVRAIDDKSGNGHHLILEGTEPGTWRQDDGASWIDIGDEISPTCSYAVTGVSLVSANAYWVCGGWRDWNIVASSHNCINLDEGAGLDRVFSLARVCDSASGEGQFTYVPFSNTGTGATFNSADNGVRSNDDFTVGLHVSGTAATGYLNGVQSGTSTVGSVPDTDASRLRICANASLTANTYLQGRFYGAIVRAGAVDLATRNADTAYIQSNMPL